MQIYALTFEYSYPNNLDGDPSPDEAGGIIEVFEDKGDAHAELRRQQETGEWGDFSAADENEGWSSGGYILAVSPHKVRPSSKKGNPGESVAAIKRRVMR